MNLDRRKIDVIRAKKQIGMEEIVRDYGASRARVYAILNSRSVTPECAGKIAHALGVDVEEILEEPGND